MKQYHFMHRFVYVMLWIAVSASAREPEAQVPLDVAHTHPPAEAHESVDVHIHSGWESRYFLEGRDSLNGDGLWATSIEMGRDHFSGGVWYGESPDQRYNELRLTLGWAEAVGDFEFYAVYTHLQFMSEYVHDNEFGVGGSWSGLPLDLVVAVDSYYSFDADGSFWQFALNRAFDLSEKLTVSGSGMYGVNQGYVADGHDGANHIAVRLGAEYALNSSLLITTHATYSWALEQNSNLPGDDSLMDFFHGGVGLQWSY